MNIVLVHFHAEYLRIITYIVIIAATVQLTEMFIKKTSPALFRELGVYLPLITTNCAVLACAADADGAELQPGAKHGVCGRGERRVLRGDLPAVAGPGTHRPVRCREPCKRDSAHASSGGDPIHGFYGLCRHGERGLTYVERFD